MSKKLVLPRHKMEYLLKLTRDYNLAPMGERGDKIIANRIALAHSIEKDSGVFWSCLFDLCAVVINMGQGDSEADLEKVLEVLGWELV